MKEKYKNINNIYIKKKDLKLLSYKKKVKWKYSCKHDIVKYQLLFQNINSNIYKNSTKSNNTQAGECGIYHKKKYLKYCEKNTGEPIIHFNTLIQKILNY